MTQIKAIVTVLAQVKDEEGNKKTLRLKPGQKGNVSLKDAAKLCADGHAEPASRKAAAEIAGAAVKPTETLHPTPVTDNPEDIDLDLEENDEDDDDEDEDDPEALGRKLNGGNADPDIPEGSETSEE